MMDWPQFTILLYWKLKTTQETTIKWQWQKLEVRSSTRCLRPWYVSLPDVCRWSLLLNFSNASNNISCEAMFVQFCCHLPELSAWMEYCYSDQPHLYLGKDIIHSCCGIQQGEPLGPLGFALTLHLLVERISAEVPSILLNAWYLDDGTVGAKVYCPGHRGEGRSPPWVPPQLRQVSPLHPRPVWCCRVDPATWCPSHTGRFLPPWLPYWSTILL